MGVKHYDKQFKERAVKLSYQRSSISQAARELGVSDSQLSRWRKDYAAGDVTDTAYKQIIISMGEGAKAALAAFDDKIRGL